MGSFPKLQVKNGQPFHFVNGSILTLKAEISGRKDPIHLEMVSDLSTESFLDALQWVTVRRGNFKNIYCGNGRDFIEARNQRQAIHPLLSEKKSQQKITYLTFKKLCTVTSRIETIFNSRPITRIIA